MRCEECNKEGVITAVCEGCIAKFIKEGEAIELKRVEEAIIKFEGNLGGDGIIFKKGEKGIMNAEKVLARLKELKSELGLKQTKEVRK